MTTKKATFQKYPAYKDSGVEWLGKIPEHWETTRLGSYFEERKIKVSDKDFAPLSVTKHGILPQLDSAAKTNDGDNRKLVRKGDFVINSRSDRKGSSGIANEDGSVSLINIVMKPISINPLFCNYLLKSNAFVEENYRIGHGIVADLWTTRYDEMKNIKIGIPSPEEQTAIAQFLDDKTAKIDRAIAQKEKMIALLKERKQIIIQHAVTKGLDPNVKMKDSGVEWIGEVPEGWEVKRLKYVMDKIQTGTTPPTSVQSYFDGGINWYNPKDLNREILMNSEKTVSQEAINRNEIKLFQKDSILIVGIGATTGKTAYMPEFGTFNQQITGLHSGNQLNMYYFYLLKSLSIVMLEVASYTTLPILNNEFFKSFWLVIPPINEQTSIVAHIEAQSAKIDKAISLQEQQIAKLKELKSTLIDSAVTGKIKVC